MHYLEQQGFKNLGKLNPGQAFMMHLDAAALTGYINIFFSTRKNPVFIIDNIHKLKSRQDLDTLQVILQYWKSLSFVFTGDKLSNELVFGQNARMIEFKIKRFAWLEGVIIIVYSFIRLFVYLFICLFIDNMALGNRMKINACPPSTQKSRIR